MMTDIDALLHGYYSWLKDNTAWQAIDKWVEITTPFLDRHNDYLQIYLKQTDDGFLLTDDGTTILGLKDEGCVLDTPRRKAMLNLILNGHGVGLEKNRLEVKATQDNFGVRKHSLIQAILAVNDMFFLATTHATSLFFEDIKTWLDGSQIRYSEQISFFGRSGYARKFDFIISKSASESERVIKTINNPSRNGADSTIMDWIDTKEVRPETAKAYAFINDNNRNVSGAMLEALRSYEIKPILWSERNQHEAELAA